jgi:hypothetical protein
LIRGGFDPAGRPFVEATVLVEDFGFEDNVEFLVDTGASATCLHHPDAAELSDSLLRASCSRKETFTGVGGTATYLATPAQIVLLDTSGGPVKYQITLCVACEARDSANGIPSLPGQDILRHQRLTHSPRDWRLEMEPLDAPSQRSCRTTSRMAPRRQP